jgi:hypothetical protein
VTDKPFKMLMCERKALLRMPGNALKIWMYYWMKEGPERLAWTTEEAVCEGTNLNKDTMHKWRNWLVDHNWLKPMGRKKREHGEFGVPVFRVKEGDAITEDFSDGRSRNFPSRSTPKTLGADDTENISGVPSNIFGEEVDTDQVDTVLVDSKLVSQSVSEIPFASLTTPSVVIQEKSSVLYWSEQEQRELSFEEYLFAQDVYLDLLPKGRMLEADVIRLAELAIKYGMTYLRAVWFWNKLHKDKGLQFRSISQFAEALESESDNNVASQMDYHDQASCPKCKKLRKCRHCHKVEDMTDSGGDDWYLHKGCEEEYRLRPKAQAAGAGFQVEEAE